jgi:hypothetical protein
MFRANKWRVWRRRSRRCRRWRWWWLLGRRRRRLLSAPDAHPSGAPVGLQQRQWLRNDQSQRVRRPRALDLGVDGPRLRGSRLRRPATRAQDIDSNRVIWRELKIGEAVFGRPSFLSKECSSNPISTRFVPRARVRVAARLAEPFRVPLARAWSQRLWRQPLPTPLRMNAEIAP